MYRIYLADDNDLFRESLIQTIPWDSMSCVLVGNAREGERACREILDLKPDIVLLDIQMPGMNGLEIASELNAKEVDCRVIIITGYSDFGYAQKSIRLGVFDYLLKPVDEYELQNVVNRAIHDLEEKRGFRQSAGGRWDSGDDTHPGAELKEAFRDALEGNEEALRTLDHAVSSKTGSVLYEIMKVRPDRQMVEEQSTEEWNRTIAAVLEEETKDAEKLAIIETACNNALYVLLLFKTFDDAKEYDVAAIGLSNRVYQSSAEAQMDVCISISACHTAFSELKDAVQQTDFAYDSRFFIENRHVIHYNSLKSRSMGNIYPIMQKVEQFYDILRKNPGDAVKALDEVENTCHEKQVLDLAVMKSILTNMAIMVGLNEEDGPEMSAEESDRKDPVQEVREAETMDDAFRILRKYTIRKSVRSKERPDSSQSEVTTRILSYLEKHYPEKIELQDICDYVGLSQGHVCRILKNDTGETFVNLLNKIRIGKAQEMLASHQYKVYEVAEATGFSNYAYFYQTYRKYVGESPTKK